MSAKRDPYRYFRVEARELLEGLGRGVLELERGAPVRREVLRLAHTLKGSARVVKQPAMAEIAHQVEEVLEACGDAPLAPAAATALLGRLDELRALVEALDPAPPAPAASVPAQPAPPTPREPTDVRHPIEASAETVRVDIREMDALLRSVSDTAVVLESLRRGLESLDAARDKARVLARDLAPRAALAAGEATRSSAETMARAHARAEALRAELELLSRALRGEVERVAAGLTETVDLAENARLVPATTILPMLERAARDAAEALGKEVAFEASGAEARLDAQILAAVAAALAHVVRNAVTHGIEVPAERAARGKPTRGTIRVRVERRGPRVSFTCEDDGGGVDIEAVRARAIASGKTSADAARALDHEGVLALLGTAGVSTSADVSELAGRGLGIDVARATAARLKGELAIRSSARVGVAVTLTVPVSIASIAVISVEASGAVADVPLDAVVGASLLGPSDVIASSDRESVLHEGVPVPLLRLGTALPVGPAIARDAERTRAPRVAVMLRAGAATVALGVDRVVGTSSVVMRPLPAFLAADPLVAGVATDAAGDPRLVLDARGVVDAATRARGVQPAPAPKRIAPILVVDDSLTTRMLEKSILESAGYEVDVATSAEEALEKARARTYAFFVVDVEMPGMSGFELVELTRADPVLAAVPAVLVTSRDAPEDRARGAAAGAVGYIVKGEFDQGVLLDTVGRFLR